MSKSMPPPDHPIWDDVTAARMEATLETQLSMPRLDGSTPPVVPLTTSDESALQLPFAVGQVLVDRYALTAVLGRGGTGVVYRAFDRGSRTWVAIKVLGSDRWDLPRLRQLVHRELRLARSIVHSNVCRVHDVLEVGGRSVLSMDLAGAGTLATSLEAGTARPWPARLADSLCLIDGLAAIHQAGVIHGDVKPQNLLRMADKRLVLADFGLARTVEHTSVSGTQSGTPGYLAPETISGGRATQAADVWALGVVLHQILTGVRPEGFPGRPLALRVLAGGGPRARALAAVCRACLQPDLRRRPPSAVAVQAWLARPSRRWHAGWALAQVGAALALLAGLLVGRPPSDDSSDRRLTKALPAVAPADWGRSRLLFTTSSDVCLIPGPPGSQRVRIRTLPDGAVDLDLKSWVGRPVQEVASMGCPSRARDGSVLFAQRTEGRYHVQLSPAADGASAVSLVPGTSPVWFSSGKEFLFVTEGQRLARGDRQGKVAFLSRPGRQPHSFTRVAIDDRDEQAAAVALYQTPTCSRELELYDLRSMSQVGTWQLGCSAIFLVHFDYHRRTFQVAAEGPDSVLQWNELTSDGRLVPLGRMRGRMIMDAVRVADGYVFGAMRQYGNDPLYRVQSDGGRLELVGEAKDFGASADGTLVYMSRVGAPFNRRVMLYRPGQTHVRLDEGTFLGIDVSSDGRVATDGESLTGGIHYCDLAAAAPRCERIWVDAGFRARPAARISPDGDQLAYVVEDEKTFQGTSFLRLLSLRDRQARELARLELQCPCSLRWMSNRTLRVCKGAGRTFSEVDVHSRRQVSRSVPGDPLQPCREPPARGPRYELRARDGYEIRYVRDDSAAQPAIPSW
jgi:hypothetical protein